MPSCQWPTLQAASSSVVPWSRLFRHFCQHGPARFAAHHAVLSNAWARPPVGQYLHHKAVKAAQGIKIAAQGLENAVAGTSLYVVGPDDDVEELKEEVMGDMQNIFEDVDKGGEGVYVSASTLGSLEVALARLHAHTHRKTARQALLLLSSLGSDAAVVGQCTFCFGDLAAS